jgi:mRNA-degrading endonuclease toxin of MazEF toxin-antitoxin module
MSDDAGRWPLSHRGEIWTASFGEKPVRHWVVIVSLDWRNESKHIGSVLIVPFSSRGGDGPTTLMIEPAESGLPRSSWVKGHFVNTIRKTQLIERHTHALSEKRMLEICMLIRCSYDPDALL